MKTLFIAELQGNYKLWKKVVALEAQSADSVIQLGNFIGLGKDIQKNNQRVIQLLAAYRYTERNWTQIVGPNEMIALNRPGVITNDSTDFSLRRLWFETEENIPSMFVAGTDHGRLITHGGLTHGLWVDLGRPDTAEEASELINQHYLNTNFQGTAYNLGHRPNFSANPIWAHPLRETYPSWVTSDEACPFPQIHGAKNINSSEGYELREDENGYLHWIEKIQHKPYGSIVFIGGTQFIGLTLNLPPIDVSEIPEGYALYFETSDE